MNECRNNYDQREDDEVVEEVVIQGHKTMISVASKSGKNFLLIEHAIALCFNNLKY